MSQYFEVHPENPQLRLLKQAVQILHGGGIAAIPTDSSYALVCHLDDKAAAENLRRIRGVDDKHHLTLLCRDLSELANYARVDTAQLAQLVDGCLVVEVAHQRVARIGGHCGDAAGMQNLRGLVQQALLRVVGVEFEGLRHGRYCQPVCIALPPPGCGGRRRESGKKRGDSGRSGVSPAAARGVRALATPA